MGTVIPFPPTAIQKLASTYVKFYVQAGAVVAGKYFNAHIPESLSKQVSVLIQKEFVRLGIQVNSGE